MTKINLIYNKQKYTIPVSPEDNTTIHLYDNGIGTLNVTSLNVINFICNTWCDITPLTIGDILDIEILEEGNVSPPMQSMNFEKFIRKSKLEIFLELEKDLKERKLI